MSIRDSSARLVARLGRWVAALALAILMLAPCTPATASFRTLPSGLTHLEFGEVDVPAKQMSLQLHNYNYNQNN